MATIAESHALIMSLPDDWETLVSTGQEVVKVHDLDRWTLGDLATRVTRRYGDESLATYAGAINSQKNTLYRYEQVSRFYPVASREAYPTLTWSHYREAMRVGSLEVAEVWLARAEDEGWPIAEMHRELNIVLGEPVPPKKVVDCTALVGHIEGRKVLFVFSSAGAATLLTSYLKANVTLRVYEAFQSGLPVGEAKGEFPAETRPPFSEKAES